MKKSDNFNWFLKIFLVLLVLLLIILSIRVNITGKAVGDVTNMIAGGPCTSDDQCESGKCLIRGGRLPGKCIECERNNECSGEWPVCKGGLPPNNICVRCYGAYIGCDSETEFCKNGDAIIRKDDGECVLKKSEGEDCRRNQECIGNCDRDTNKCVAKKELGESCEFSSHCITEKCYGNPKVCINKKDAGHVHLHD